jgi:membrane protein YqaA with SNARE-associated domain
LSPDALVVRLGFPLATFAYCVASGFIPVLNAEVFLVGIAAIAPRESLPAVAALAAAGQMFAKAGMYLGGRGVVRLPRGKRHEDIARWQERVARWRSKDLLVFVSASVGLPPLFVLAVLAGTLRFPFVRFLVAGFLGRLLRFAVVVAVPAVGRWIVHG